MIYVRYTHKESGKREIVQIDERHDPFAVLAEIAKKFDCAAPKGSSLPGTSTRLTAEGAAVRLSYAQGAIPSAPAAKPRRAEAEDPGTVTPAAPAGVRDTSHAAYRALEYSGKVSRQQLLLTQFFLANPQRTFTRQELSNATGLPINVICGRVKELLKKPLLFLVEVEKRECRITHEMVWALELVRTSFVKEAA